MVLWKYTRALSTPGTGQKMFLPILPAKRAGPYQAIFNEGTPYSLLFGAAASRCATSACTITNPFWIDGNWLMKCSSTGTEMLYGKLATNAVGAPGSSFTLRASATTSSSSLPGACFAIVLGSSSANRWSISTAITFGTISRIPSVSEPKPGPISTTRSSLLSSAAETILRIVFGSITKF